MSENKKTEIKPGVKTFILHPWRLFAFEAFLFAATLALGILAGLRLKEIFESQKISPEPVSVWQFLFYFVSATAVLLLIIYFLKPKRAKGVLFKLFFILAIIFGNFYFVGLWLPPFFVFAWLVFLLVFLFKKHLVFLHNLALILAIAGVGAGVGLQLQAKTVLVLLLIFSIYDFVAVYKTKHMVKFAETMVEHKAIAGFIVPQNLSGFQADVKKVKLGREFLILGGGDVVFPLIFAVVLLKEGVLNGLIVALFSLFGLFCGFLIFISKKNRAPMPALPPIALFSIIGYLLTMFL